MELAWGTETGVFYDSRTILIAAVSSTYSVFITLIMIVIGVVFRLYMSGDGAIAGVITIVCTGLLGIIFKKYILPKTKSRFYLSYLLFGIVVHIFMLLYHFSLPKDLDFILERIRIIAPYVLTVYPIMVVILVSMIKQNDKRISFNETLAESEENYEILFNNFSSGIIYFDENGIIIKCNDKFLNIMSATRKQMIGLNMNILPDSNFQKVFPKVMRGIPTVFHNNYKSYISQKDLFLHIDFQPAYKESVFKGGIGIVDDLTESETLKEQMIEVTRRDPITGFNNRKSFEEDISTTMFDELYPLEFLMISVDNMQFYIDTLGYTKADNIMKEFSNYVRASYRDDIYIYRFSLNDFVMIYSIEYIDNAKKVLRQLRDQMKAIESVTPSVSFTYSTVEMEKKSNWYDTTNALRNKIYSFRTYTKSNVTKNSIDLLMASLFEKSPRERQHSERVSKMSVQLAECLDIDAEMISRIRVASILHDIGKLNVDLTILDKKGRLTDEEYQKVQSHTESGFRILSTVNEYKELAKIVLAHHERYDGTGYPFNIKGDNIPFESRIISVVDSYDAMINDRPYRNALSQEQAIQELKDNSGTQFDPNIVEQFLSCFIKDNL